MDIEDLTLKQIRELQAIFGNNSNHSCDDIERAEHVGKNICVRTVTMIFTGKCIAMDATNIVLLEASWIPDTSRWAQFVESGNPNECEPYPEDLKVFISRASKLDSFEMKSKLPRSQK